ncbi:MAG: circularly permuted type 2 ATP-grasp protein [Lacipirellulaceae bacterium]
MQQQQQQAVAAPRTSAFVCPPSVYNEALDEHGAPRPHWRQAFASLNAYPSGELARRVLRANRRLAEDGATFDVFSNEEKARGPLRFDLLPLVVSAEEWSSLMAGLDQRARLLDLVARDLNGPQRLLDEGLFPAEALFRNPAFHRAFHDLRPSEETRLGLYAAEMARSPSGQWFVMADRTDAPSGLGFALENRLVSLQCLPKMLHDVGIQRLASWFAALQESIAQRYAGKTDSPRVALLTTGPSSPFYFEDVFLARYLGYILVEGGDLSVRGEHVFLKTLDGLAQIDAIVVRGAERGLDPLELGGAWNHGVPGLMQVVRSGNVALVNTPGCSLLEAPVFMALLPKLCRATLGEELALPSIATWWCGDAESRRYVEANLANLVVKPAFQASGGQELVVSELSAERVQHLRARMAADPSQYVAQEKIARSAAPAWRGEPTEIGCGHVAVRAFLCRPANEGAADSGYLALPGGLVRVAPTVAPMELSITAGDQSKDLWVLADRQIETVSLLEPAGEPTQLRRSGAMFPSRVADNLFWLGLSVQRCELLARLLRATSERLNAETEGEFPELPMLVRALSQQGQLDPGFSLEDFSGQLPSLAAELPRVATDLDEPRGLARATAEVRRLALASRNWLSPDAWRRLYGAANEYLGAATQPPADCGELLARLDPLLGGLAAAVGLIQEGMIRGPAWRFLDIGRRIESARGVAGLTRVALEADHLAQRAVLRTLLELVDCQMTYRSRYLDRVQQHAVLDLVIVDETNPKSLSHELARAADHVDALPDAGRNPLVDPDERVIAVALFDARMLRLEDLCEDPPTRVLALLKDSDRRLSELVDVLTSEYLVHSGPARQIG